MSQQRPMSAGGAAEGGRAEAAQTGKASGAADSERSRSIDLSDMSVGDGYSDNSQKSSFYTAVREYERNLSSLRKERDDLLVCVCVCMRVLTYMLSKNCPPDACVFVCFFVCVRACVRACVRGDMHTVQETIRPMRRELDEANNTIKAMVCMPTEPFKLWERAQ